MNKSLTFAIRGTAIGAVVALGFSAGTAFAASPSNDQGVSDGAKQYVVQFADLDLSKMAGAITLYGRLQQAARVVCRPLESRELAGFIEYRACLNQAVTRAVARVNRPLLSEYHQSRTKRGNVGPLRLAKAM
jgi:UrcA family protein